MIDHIKAHNLLESKQIEEKVQSFCTNLKDFVEKKKIEKAEKEEINLRRARRESRSQSRNTGSSRPPSTAPIYERIMKQWLAPHTQIDQTDLDYYE